MSNEVKLEDAKPGMWVDFDDEEEGWKGHYSGVLVLDSVPKGNDILDLRQHLSLDKYSATEWHGPEDSAQVIRPLNDFDVTNVHVYKHKPAKDAINAVNLHPGDYVTLCRNTAEDCTGYSAFVSGIISVLDLSDIHNQVGVSLKGFIEGFCISDASDGWAVVSSETIARLPDMSDAEKGRDYPFVADDHKTLVIYRDGDWGFGNGNTFTGKMFTHYHRDLLPLHELVEKKEF